MADGVKCFWETERIEMGEAAKGFDDQLCAGCSHFPDCEMIWEGAGREQSKSV